MKNQDAAVECQLHRAEATRCKVRVAAPRPDVVQVEGQLDTRSWHGDGLCARYDVDETRYVLQEAIVIAQRQSFRPFGRRAHCLVAQVGGHLQCARALAFGAR